MSRPSAIDRPISLADLLAASELEEIARSYVELHDVPVWIRDREGALWAGDGAGRRRTSGTQQIRVLMLDDQRLGEVIVGPYDGCEINDEHAGAVADAVTRVLLVLARVASARHSEGVASDTPSDDDYLELAVTNRRLARSIERLQEVENLKSSFLATVSHELRTPLTSVIGYSEMLLEGLAGSLNGEQTDYVSTILSKADQLLQVITGILDVSMIESGTLRMARAPVAIDELIAEVVDAFEPQAKRQGIVFIRPSRLGLRVLGDAKKIQQILTHLVTNAIKFTRSGGSVGVELGLGPLGRADDAADEAVGLKISVTDSGIGIPPEKQAHIFEPFFQVDSSSTREYGGTGLGLTLVKNYAEAHGGQVSVVSEFGCGSKFIVSLPAVPEDLRRYFASQDPSE